MWTGTLKLLKPIAKLLSHLMACLCRIYRRGGGSDLIRVAGRGGVEPLGLYGLLQVLLLRGERALPARHSEGAFVLLREKLSRLKVLYLGNHCQAVLLPRHAVAPWAPVVRCEPASVWVWCCNLTSEGMLVWALKDNLDTKTPYRMYFVVPTIQCTTSAAAYFSSDCCPALCAGGRLVASTDHAAGEGPALVMAVGGHNSHLEELVLGRSIDVESACYTTYASALPLNLLG